MARGGGWGPSSADGALCFQKEAGACVAVFSAVFKSQTSLCPWGGSVHRELENLMEISSKVGTPGELWFPGEPGLTRLSSLVWRPQASLQDFPASPRSLKRDQTVMI